jgi:hypothetical protein
MRLHPQGSSLVERNLLLVVSSRHAASALKVNIISPKVISSSRCGFNGQNTRFTLFRESKGVRLPNPTFSKPQTSSHSVCWFVGCLKSQRYWNYQSITIHYHKDYGWYELQTDTAYLCTSNILKLTHYAAIECGLSVIPINNDTKNQMTAMDDPNHVENFEIAADENWML